MPEATLKTTKKSGARSLPSVDAVLRLPAAVEAVERYGRSVVVAAVRDVIGGLRTVLLEGRGMEDAELESDSVLARALEAIEGGRKMGLRRVINATGIVLHTGLGRAPMPETAADALRAAIGFCNVQTDLESGKRNRREETLRDLVRGLTGAEEIALVNNNAAATFLVLRALAHGKEVIVSRGELIEIGGSFRLPDIMRESGAVLKEVGTTNKTHPADYEKAIGPDTGLILKAHKSNYDIVGFCAEVSIGRIAEIGKKHGIPVADDLGCGALVGLEMFGMGHEVTVRESLEAGADLALFSTDKLIGGPQGGLIVGRKEIVERVRSHPMYRTFRACKLTIAALQASLRSFLAPEKLAGCSPMYAMIARVPSELKRQAEDAATRIQAGRPDWNVSVMETRSKIGGGSLPSEDMPSFAVALTADGMSAGEMNLVLRTSEVPVIGRIADGAVVLDMRTVSPSDLDELIQACIGQKPTRGGKK